MATPKVKICGITNLEDARYCAGAGADYLGFIQYPDSPRYIRPDFAHQIIEWVHGTVSVGVFVNETAERTNAIAEEAGFDVVQASGTESPNWCASIHNPVVKTMHVSKDDTPASLLSRMAPFVPHVSRFLLDTAKLGYWGGTGHSFDWTLLQDEALCDMDLFVAGGLTPDNIIEVINLSSPFALDLSSGLEESPGRKDYGLVTCLFEHLRMDG